MVALGLALAHTGNAQTCTFSNSSWLVYDTTGTPTTANWLTTNNTNFISAAPSTVDDTFGANIPGQVTYHSAAGRFPGITASNLIWNNALGHAHDLVFKTTVTASECDSIVIRVAADDRVDSVWVNGTNVLAGSAGGWTNIDVISIPPSLVNAGNNYICIQASDAGRHASWMLAQVCIYEKSCCEDGCAWILDGNHTDSLRNILGTLSNQDVRLYTNNLQRGLMTKTGNFGWNTTSPTAKMHVNVTGLTSTTGIRFQGLLSASDTTIMTVDASGNIHTRSYPPAGITNSCTMVNRVPRTVSATGNLGCGQIYDDGINVGVNTTAPAATLDIANRTCDNQPALRITNDETVACPMPTVSGDYIDCKGFGFGGTITQRFIVKETGWVGVNRTPSYPLDVAGTIRANTTLYSSDLRFKKEVKVIDEPIELLKQLNGKSYYFKTESFPAWHFDAEKQYGFIAQELKQVMPELVKEDKDGYLGVNYVMLIPILTEAIKEQQARIEQLERKIKELNAPKNTTGISESNTGDAFLSQNVPNPFTRTTEIRYQLPAGTQRAAIGIYDMNGKELRQIPLGAETKGAITINAAELQAGMYLYTLIVDGRAFDTKRMVLTAQ